LHLALDLNLSLGFRIETNQSHRKLNTEQTSRANFEKTLFASKKRALMKINLLEPRVLCLLLISALISKLEYSDFYLVAGVFTFVLALISVISRLSQ
jgi:hypothetical protein